MKIEVLAANSWAGDIEDKTEGRERQIFNYGFLWSICCYFYMNGCVCVCSVRARSGDMVMWMASLKQISSISSGCQVLPISRSVRDEKSIPYDCAVQHCYMKKNTQHPPLPPPPSQYTHPHPPTHESYMSGFGFGLLLFAVWTKPLCPAVSPWQLRNRTEIFLA